VLIFLLWTFEINVSSTQAWKMLVCMICDDMWHVSVVFQHGEPTPVSTGYLEVQIVGGKLLHSKKVNDLMYIEQGSDSVVCVFSDSFIFETESEW